jgi:clan AA aspartic protease (TIGR02281 family)
MKKSLIILLCFPMIGFGQCFPPDGCENGNGTYTYPSGNKYVGEWKDDKRNGFGTFYYDSDQRYEGEWLNGEKHGDGAEYYNDGRIWEGNWIEGEQTEGHFNNENYYDPNHIKGQQISSTINLKEIEKDAFYISIDFNGLKKDFTFDTGATDLTISSDLLLELERYGIKIRDLKIDAGFATTASGQKVSSKDYVIDNIRIGDYLLNNVVVTVGAKGTSSLCGIRLFNKFSNVHWDMQKEQLILYR